MSETDEMRYGESTVTMTHRGRTVEATLDALADAVEAPASRLPGTDYAKLTFTKANSDWLPDPLRIGDEIKLVVTATVIGTGKELTKDGLKPTAKLEVSGVTRLD